MAVDLGELRKMDVRQLWPNEAADFSPWLATDENIRRLGSALRLELEVENTEVAVGPYSADIVARNSGTEAYVVIENQLGKTDHDHLGKVLTYAAALSAGALVWVAPEFTEEHRKAIDWLNDNSSGDVAFYGVQIELWQIDQSRPAVRFNVLARPAGATVRAAITKATGALSDTRKLQLEWWTAVRDALLAKKVVPSAQTPAPRYWYNVALGRSGIYLSNIADTDANRIGVRVYMRNKYNAEAALQQLLEHKAEIEAGIGEPLAWNPNPDAIDKVIALTRDADLTSREKWPEYIDWMVQMTDGFRRTFGPRVKQLDLEPHEEPEEEADG
ncbi:MAG TPA: DUF4268 domain-containing protein [Gemmatimonadales bacterium]